MLRDITPAKALSYCEVAMITSADLFEVLERFPASQAVVRQAALKIATSRAMITISIYASLATDRRKRNARATGMAPSAADGSSMKSDGMCRRSQSAMIDTEVLAARRARQSIIALTGDGKTVPAPSMVLRRMFGTTLGAWREIEYVGRDRVIVEPLGDDIGAPPSAADVGIGRQASGYARRNGRASREPRYSNERMARTGTPLRRARSALTTEAADDKKILALFKRHDADSSGDIDATELRGVLEELGVPVDSEEADDLLAKFDADESGRVEFAEFKQLVKQLRQVGGTQGALSAREPSFKLAPAAAQVETPILGVPSVADPRLEALQTSVRGIEASLDTLAARVTTIDGTCNGLRTDMQSISALLQTIAQRPSMLSKGKLAAAVAAKRSTKATPPPLPPGAIARTAALRQPPPPPPALTTAPPGRRDDDDLFNLDVQPLKDAPARRMRASEGSAIEGEPTHALPQTALRDDSIPSPAEPATRSQSSSQSSSSFEARASLEA